LCYQQKVNLCIYGPNGHGCFLKTFSGVINDEDSRTHRVDAIFTQSGLQNWCWIYLFALKKLPKETDWCVPLSTVAILAVSTVISIAHV